MGVFTKPSSLVSSPTTLKSQGAQERAASGSYQTNPEMNSDWTNLYHMPIPEPIMVVIVPQLL